MDHCPNKKKIYQCFFILRFQLFMRNYLNKLTEILKFQKTNNANRFYGEKKCCKKFLGVRKLFSKWVPRLLTPDQKQQRVEDSERCLELFKRGKKDVLRQYVTMDETWIHHYTPETKWSSAEYIAAGESRPKRPKTQQWAGKVMAFVFWDEHGILFINYLEKSKTINSDYYIALLDRLSAEMKKKRPRM